MADEVVVAYEETPLNSAIGRGSIYRILGIVVAVALVLTVIIGLTAQTGPGLFSDGTAFVMGGLAIVVLAVATLVLLFSLTGTIRYINREMQDLTRLRKSIEVSYARLATSAENLGKEIGELRSTLPTMRKLAAEVQKINRRQGRTTVTVEETTAPAEETLA